MAADFSTSGTRNLGCDSPINSVPLTMSCWFKTPANNVQKTLISIGVANATHRCLLQISATNLIQAFSIGSISASSTFNTSISNNEWSHACGVFSATNSRTAYLNGSGATTNTANATQNSFNDLRIGARWSNTLGVHMRGLIAEVGVWDIALNSEEIISLSRGMACSKIRPQSLIFYTPLIREFNDIIQNITITNNGVTVADHTRIYL